MALQNNREHAATDATSRWLTLPNALSILRLILAPIVVWLVLTGSVTALTLAVALMVVAELTDFFDGYLARALKQESDIGRVIDPVCDVIYHVSVFLAFVRQGWMAPWMLFLIYARDLGVPYLRTLARQRGVDIGVRWSGKIKTAVHGVAQILVVLVALGFMPQTMAGGFDTVFALLLVATLASLVSLADYASAAFR
ncbi:MAG: CDP-diacylglycerol--glycerol-3-phosphate 3-phosphatidyltransferase [Alphaproteobacteria bacterium]|nr:CDP-diacylglycerol--glycerol-3-phosphate 3-phosphatidyltransferase [Alphaproteobacteria bacterium]